MFHWLIGIFDEQPTEDSKPQWRARKQVMELVDCANNAQAEWEGTTSKWEAQRSKLLIWNTGPRMENRMQVRGLIWIQVVLDD